MLSSRPTEPAGGGPSPLSPGTVSSAGGQMREDGRVSFGYSLMRGRRAAMEDFYAAEFKKDARTGEVVGLFAVFDGHGGPHAAAFAQNTLFTNMLQSAKFPVDLRGAITDSFHATDEQYLKQDSGAKREDGSTAVTAVLFQHRLLIANAGDSRAVLSRAGQAVPLTIDHKPNNKEERQRVEDAGGVVVWAGTWRVGGVLAVSRALGDKPLKKYVIATPHTHEEHLTHADEFLILASDGLWDVVNNQEAVTLIREVKDAEKAAKRLSEEAFARGSADNITVIVVRFKH